MVEHIEEARVERQAGAEHRCHHNVVGGQVDLRVGHGCADIFRGVVECLAYLVCHHLADAADVVAEQKAVLLVVLVAEFGKILVHH